MKIGNSPILSLCDNKSIGKKGESYKTDFFEVIEDTLENQTYDNDLNIKKVNDNYTDNTNEALDKENDINDKLSEIIIAVLTNINIDQDKNVKLTSQISKSNLVDIVEQESKNLSDLLFVKNNINYETNNDISNKTNFVNEERFDFNLNNYSIKDKFKNILSNENILDTLKEMNFIDDKVLEDILINSSDKALDDKILELLYKNITAFNENKIDKLANEDVIKNIFNNDDKLTLEGLVNEIKLTNKSEEISNSSLQNNKKDWFNEINFSQNKTNFNESQSNYLNLDSNLNDHKIKDILFNTNIVEILKEIDVIDSDLFKTIKINKNTTNNNDKLSNKVLEGLIQNINDINSSKDTNIENFKLFENEVNSKTDNNNLTTNEFEIIKEKLDKVIKDYISKEVVNEDIKIRLEGIIDKFELLNDSEKINLDLNNINLNKDEFELNKEKYDREIELRSEGLFNSIKPFNNEEINTSLLQQDQKTLFNEFNLFKNKINFVKSENNNIDLNDYKFEEISSNNILSVNTNNTNLKKNNIEITNEKIIKVPQESIQKEIDIKDNKLTLESLINEIKSINNTNKNNDSLSSEISFVKSEIIINEQENNLTSDNDSSNDNFKDLFDMSYIGNESTDKKSKIKEHIEYDTFSEYENSNNIIKNNTINEKKAELIKEDFSNIEIRREYIREDFIKTIDYIKSNDMEEFIVKMNPKDLGEISIKIFKSESEEKITINLDNEEVLKLLNDNINEIQAHLHNKDIVSKAVNIEIKNDNLSNFAGDLERDLNKNNHKEEKRNRKNIIKSDTKDNYLEKDDTSINLLI